MQSPALHAVITEVFGRRRGGYIGRSVSPAGRKLRSPDGTVVFGNPLAAPDAVNGVGGQGDRDILVALPEAKGFPKRTPAEIEAEILRIVLLAVSGRSAGTTCKMNFAPLGSANRTETPPTRFSARSGSQRRPSCASAPPRGEWMRQPQIRQRTSTGRPAHQQHEDADADQNHARIAGYRGPRACLA